MKSALNPHFAAHSKIHVFMATISITCNPFFITRRTINPPHKSVHGTFFVSYSHRDLIKREGEKGDGKYIIRNLIKL